MYIEIDVQNKIAKRSDPNAYIVCGNSDYILKFNFDEEWQAYEAKTARFYSNGEPEDVVFKGDECPVPVMERADGVFVGVFAGDLKTTTKAYIPCERCILCLGGKVKEPKPDVYAQLMQMINDGMLRGEQGEQGEKGEKGDAGSVKLIPVAELPTENIEEDAIYLLPIEGSEENRFAEYVYIDGKWEVLGAITVNVDHSEFVKKTDYATSKIAGVLKCDGGYGITVDEYGRGKIVKAEKADIFDKSNSHNPIVPALQDYAWKQSAINNKETWTDTEKCTLREFIGAERPTIAIFKFEEGDNLTIKIDGISGKYKIDWGDGSSNNASGTAENVTISHTYPSAGTYNCTLCGIRGFGEGAFLNNTNLHSIELSNSINTLGDFVFRGCSNLRSVKLSNTAPSLGKGVFYGCGSLHHMLIPANITAVGGSLFYKCTSLVSVEFENKVPIPYATDMFKSCTALSKIIVPYNSFTAYKEQWTEVADKIDRIAYKAEFPHELMFGYQSVHGTHPIKRNGYYMCYSEKNDLKLCKKDGTVVVEGAKQIHFMASPYVDEPSAKQFNVSGMYWTGTSILTGVEGFRRTTDDGGYITGGSVFYVAQMVKE